MRVRLCLCVYVCLCVCVCMCVCVYECVRIVGQSLMPTVKSKTGVTVRHSFALVLSVRCSTPLDLPPSPLCSLSFNPNMKQIASGSLDNSVMVWNFKPQVRPQPLPLFSLLCLSAGRRRLALVLSLIGRSTEPALAPLKVFCVEKSCIAS